MGVYTEDIKLMIITEPKLFISSEKRGYLGQNFKKFKKKRFDFF